LIQHEVATVLQFLRGGVDNDITMITGGRGALDGLTGIERIVDFEVYLERLRSTMKET